MVLTVGDTSLLMRENVEDGIKNLILLFFFYERRDRCWC